MAPGVKHVSVGRCRDAPVDWRMILVVGAETTPDFTEGSDAIVTLATERPRTGYGPVSSTTWTSPLLGATDLP